MANTSILAAFERMWQHVANALSAKSDTGHKHDISDVEDLQSTLDNKTVVKVVRWS